MITIIVVIICILLLLFTIIIIIINSNPFAEEEIGKLNYTGVARIKITRNEIKPF